MAVTFFICQQINVQVSSLPLDIQIWSIYINNEPTKIDNFRYSEVVQTICLQDYLFFWSYIAHMYISILWY